MPFGVEDVIEYIETTANAVTDLQGQIKTTRPAEPIPAIKTYGLRIYFGEQDWHSIDRRKIGPIVTETFRVNVDLVFNRNLTPRQVFSDLKGISYWDRLLVNLFGNRNNDGRFKDSLWAPSVSMEQNAESTILKGILTIVVENFIVH